MFCTILIFKIRSSTPSGQFLEFIFLSNIVIFYEKGIWRIQAMEYYVVTLTDDEIQELKKLIYIVGD